MVSSPRLISHSSGLRIAGLRKGYGQDGVVLDSLDLTVEAGELVTVIGSSGTGKTTLLRCIAGLEPYDAGTITLDGMHLQSGDISYVFQKPILYPHLNVQDNILFGTRLKGYRQKLDRDYYRALLEILSLDGLEKRKPSQLSGGQAQRVGIARALVRKPALVLFDEPLASVDEAMSAEIRSDLITLHKELKFTALFITHDQNEALQLGNRVAVLADGYVIQCSSPNELLANPSHIDVALLTGSPKFNTFCASYRANPLTVGARATSFKVGEDQAQKLVVDIIGRRSLTSGILYSARTVGEQLWQVDGQDGVRLEENQPVEFVAQLDEALNLTGIQTLSVNPDWCFAFDSETGRRINLAQF